MSLSILYVSLLSLILPLSGTDPILDQKNPVTIGLLVSDSSHTRVIKAAEEAIKKANDQGGIDGALFKLVVRSTEGPWGAGSKESVGLVYDDEVRAIVGSLDGRNAHLAEQVAAKSHLVYLETRASDPTLSQAYVPWFFRNVPNDDQQAEAILDLIGKRGAGKILFLSSQEYGDRYALNSLSKASLDKFEVPPRIIYMNQKDPEMEAVLDQVLKAAPDHLVITSFSEANLSLISKIKKQLPQLKLYGTLACTLSLHQKSQVSKSLDGMCLIHSYKSSKAKSMADPEDLAASYASDGMMLIIQAILDVGLERESIRDYLLAHNHPEGYTGPMQFDALGNRSGRIRFIRILDGVAVPME